MPFTCEWKVPGRVLFAGVGPSLTMEEVGVFARTAEQFITQSGQPPVYFMVDFSTLREAPSQLSQLQRASGTGGAQEVGCYFFIAANPIQSFVAAALVKMLQRPVRIVATFAEAVASLHEFDPGLAALLQA